jgi:hypothetical protein
MFRVFIICFVLASNILSFTSSKTTSSKTTSSKSTFKITSYSSKLHLQSSFSYSLLKSTEKNYRTSSKLQTNTIGVPIISKSSTVRTNRTTLVKKTSKPISTNSVKVTTKKTSTSPKSKTRTTTTTTSKKKTTTSSKKIATATQIIDVSSRCGTNWQSANSKCGESCSKTLTCSDPSLICFKDLETKPCNDLHQPVSNTNQSYIVNPQPVLSNNEKTLPIRQFSRLVGYQYFDKTTNSNVWETNSVQTIDQCESLCSVGCDFYQYTAATKICTLHYADKTAHMQLYFIGQTNSNWMHGDLNKGQLLKTFTGVTSGPNCLMQCAFVGGSQYATWFLETNNPLIKGKECNCYSFYVQGGTVLGYLSIRFCCH